MQHDTENKKPETDHLVIHVNGKLKNERDGVTDPMDVGAIAALVGLTADTAVVREQQGESGKAGEPLTGSIAIKSGMHFLVTRKGVNGGWS